MKFVEEAGLPIDDLFGLVIDHPKYHSSDGVHFSNEGKTVQVRQVAASIVAQLTNSIGQTTVRKTLCQRP